ncbi:hypothetical protein IEQ34_017585 [Dendrobium chrysotoxum]|uniref:Uncharacterized protein n=1 Tax=Dendrobium chrysotoxum TaxID=161865 RepID=A0AAV7GAM1_DENCH|nr:hypothetical protein IEQ34_017585 [Dendrobium chrysotoxum]
MELKAIETLLDVCIVNAQKFIQIKRFYVISPPNAVVISQAVERAAGSDGQKITYTVIKHQLGDLFYRLVSQKFEDPAEGEEALSAKFKKLYEDLTIGFRNLEDERR